MGICINMTYLPDYLTWDYLLNKVSLKSIIKKQYNCDSINSNVFKDVFNQCKTGFTMLKKTGLFIEDALACGYPGVIVTALKKMNHPIIYFHGDYDDDNDGGSVIMDLNFKGQVNTGKYEDFYNAHFQFINLMKLFFEEHKQKAGSDFLKSYKIIETLKGD